MIVVTTKATALNLRMTLHSNFGLGVATNTVEVCSASLSKLSEVDAEKRVCWTSAPMSALGLNRTCAAQKVMSALPPKADILRAERDVR